MQVIINTRSDLESLKGGDDYAGALRAILGSTTAWTNRGTQDAPDWKQETALEHIQALGFETLDELLAECAAAGVSPQASTPPPAVEKPPLTADDVRAEARRRITALMPEHKQRNNMAKAIEMIMAHGRDLTKWPEKQQVEQTKMLAVWEKIEAIQAKSNTLEAKPPGDFNDDSHWPSSN